MSHPAGSTEESLSDTFRFDPDGGSLQSVAEHDWNDGAELTTDEVLRSGAERLRTSRDVLSMIDEALTKSRDVLERGPRIHRSDDVDRQSSEHPEDVRHG